MAVGGRQYSALRPAVPDRRLPAVAAAALNQMKGLAMQLPENAVLLRIYLGENDRFEHRPALRGDSA